MHFDYVGKHFPSNFQGKKHLGKSWNDSKATKCPLKINFKRNYCNKLSTYSSSQLTFYDESSLLRFRGYIQPVAEAHID